ncbi:malate synthase A [Virgibacillus sp. LDC-1]|uniref:malate synthase A n=1 Tax=Virgibacillus sp. LDC-1 TaxID=3039856 RepID=UPI0024DEE8B4|nr:malate synthase A [Virgibacillus sp. LDC-1]
MLLEKSSLQIRGEIFSHCEAVLTEEAREFLVKLHHRFNDRRKNLLAIRKQIQQKIKEGKQLDFLPETKSIREGDWQVAPLPKDLQDRRVEITGPVDRKMIINALNSGATGFMSDFEDATSPTWRNILEGQQNLIDAVRRKIDFVGSNGKHYALNKETAVLMVRPRGLHLEEKHLFVEGKAMAASFVDFGLFFYHNAQALCKQGAGPYFYLPKLENHLEARLWNDIFIFAQKELGFPEGTIKATVLIETITAAFEMDEILYELKEHAAGLNCGRWDYIFSVIKKFHDDPDLLLPNRDQITMNVPFMRAYTQLAVKTCHKRNASAIGGMAAQIPVKDDEVRNKEAFMKVRLDKERERNDGFDGTWVAHPGMVQLVKEVFNEGMPTPNQLFIKREDVDVGATDLLQFPSGSITEAGLRTNIRVAIEYTAYWLQGYGAVPINHLMEDAATAEISRAQIWQWVRHEKGILEDGRKITLELVFEMMQTEVQSLCKNETKLDTHFIKEAEGICRQLIKEDSFTEFLTLPAYEQLIRGGENG